MENAVCALLLMLFSAPAMADWMCEVYCPTGDGFRWMAEHANHPVDALNAVNNACIAAYGGHDSGRVYVQGPNGLVAATVENACKRVDVSCH